MIQPTATKLGRGTPRFRQEGRAEERPTRFTKPPVFLWIVNDTVGGKAGTFLVPSPCLRVPKRHGARNERDGWLPEYGQGPNLSAWTQAREIDVR